MTYQSKHYRKFIASGMTAAMVAAAVAPSAGFAASDFKDVSPDNFYYDYVMALADADIIDGRPDGTFDLGGKITRAEASKMVANILKLDTDSAPAADFKDVDQSVWYAEYINALYDEGLIDGKGAGMFDPKGTLTRGEFAKMVVDAYDLSLNPDGPKVNFTDVKESKWYAEYIEILYSHGLITGTTSTTFSPDAQIKRADFAKLLTETDWAVGSTLEKPNEGATEVASVRGVNAKTIEVKFSEPIDADTLKTADGSDVITLVPGKEAVRTGDVTQALSEDGKTLTFKTTEIFSGDYLVKVPYEGVKDVDGEYVKPINAPVNVNDKAAPVLTSAKAMIKDTSGGIQKITLTFDEEVTSIETVKIGNANYTAKIDGNKATVDVNLDASQSHNVTVVNAKDAVGNVKDVQAASLAVTVDNVAPSVANVAAAGEDQVKVTVDEELNGDTLKVTGKVGTYTANVVEDVEVNPANHKEYFITLNSDYLYKSGNSDTVTLTFAKGALVDEMGNENTSNITKTVTVSKDVTAPAPIKVATSKTDGKVTSFAVTYNEEVNSPDRTKISVVNSKGEIFTVSQVVDSLSMANGSKTVVFALDQNLEADKYSFVLGEGFVVDDALTPNKSEQYNFSVEVTEDGQPPATTFEIVGASANDNVITVDYGAKVKATGTGSALNPDAYEVNGVTLPSGTNIAFVRNNTTVDQTKVQITLPDGFVKESDDKAIFTVDGVQTLDNKESQPFTKTIAITDNTAPEVTSFVATELNKLTVTYSEPIEVEGLVDGVTASIADEISLLNSSGAKVEFTGYDVTDDGKLVLTVADSALVNKLVTNKVDDANADIQDEAGNAQKAGLTVTK
ncbi:S-layer homology domain-containing protein [Bacillus sp. ISL-47]|uniref:S-layer homology domain-containing protein n=1 Tax=Bacillus sp. ISL-47 TaxID=2819130 RepID=UPI001BE8EE89|nr:S-layer homology domain-containing protein [Bacillus sp. ISL-47]MBT2687389.1 S-layer homology domain-containing protein [Bacillus sp. ISL-47]MBT2707149.1 S-layer homology domain-containing protein [Pseudomonas sp. ISL-84]